MIWLRRFLRAAVSALFPSGGTCGKVGAGNGARPLSDDWSLPRAAARNVALPEVTTASICVPVAPKPARRTNLAALSQS